MKRMLITIAMILIMISLVACEAEIIEVPVITTEVQIVEVPVIITEIEEVIKYEDTMTKLCFWTADTDLIILAIGKGDITYVMEFAYIIADNRGYLIQIERQTLGVTDDYFFLADYSGSDDEAYNNLFDESDWYEFAAEVCSIFDDMPDDEIWSSFEIIYQELYDNYYSVDTGADL